MNMRWKENPAFLQVLLGCLLILFLLTCRYVLGLLGASISGLDLIARANSMRTAIALTSGALLGPFPTATGPTPTASKTPSITPTPTITASPTPSRTPFRYFIDTGTPRTLVPGIGPTSTSVLPAATHSPPTSAPRATRTSIPPTNPPQPTNPPPQPTNPHRRATKTPKPKKKPTKTPKKHVPLGYIDPLSCPYLPLEYDPWRSATCNPALFHPDRDSHYLSGFANLHKQ